MVEPVAAALNPFNNFFYPNLALQLLNLAVRRMSTDASPLSALGTDSTVFHRTRAKGKERAVPESESTLNMHWLHGPRCRPHTLPSFNSTHANLMWRLAASNSLPALSIFSPAATRGFPSNFVPCQIRRSSNAVAVEAPAPPEPPDPGLAPAVLGPPMLLIESFISGIRMRNSGRYVGKGTAWSALEQVRARSSFPPVDLHGFLEQLDRSMMGNEALHPDPENVERVRLWAGRAFELLQLVRGDNGGVSQPTDQWLSLSARFHAMLGNIEEATALCERIAARRIDADASMPASDRAVRRPRSPGPYEVASLFTLLNMIYHHGNARAVFAFLLSRWDTVTVHVLDPFVRLRSSNKTVGQPLHTALFPMLDGLVSLTPHIAGTVEERTRIGHLLTHLLVMRGVPDEAIIVHDFMDEHGLKLPVPLRMHLVKALIKGRARENAAHLFANIDPEALDWSDDALVDQYLATGLTVHSSRGNVDKAEEFFAAMEKRGLASFRKVSQLLQTYANARDKDGAVAAFQRFFADEGAQYSPDAVHYTAMIMAHARSQDSDGVRHWLQRMLDAHYAPDVPLYSVLVQHYAKIDDTETVASLVDQMLDRKLRPSPEVFTTVITMFGKKSNAVAAEDVYRRAVKVGVKPDRLMIGALISAHAESGSWQGSLRAFDYLLRQAPRHFRPGAHEFNSLIKTYVLFGAPFWAVQDLLDKMERHAVRPTMHTYSLAIQSAADHGRMDTATGLYRHLDRLARDERSGFEMNVYALTILMSGWLRAGDPDRARTVYQGMIDRGIQPSAVTYGAIIKHYAAEGTEEGLEQARTFLEGIMSGEQSETLVKDGDGTRSDALQTMYAPLMRDAARQRDPERIAEFQAAVQAAGGDRKIELLAIALDAHRANGDVGAARAVFGEAYARAVQLSSVRLLTAKDGPEKRPSSLISLVLSIQLDVLSAAGAHAEVARTWTRVHDDGFAFSSFNWNALVVALVRAGEVPRAFSILERVILPNRARARESLPKWESHHSPLLSKEEVEEALEGVGRQSADARVMAARKLEKYVAPADMTGADDGVHGAFVHPLRLLQHVAPDWHQWRPHNAIVRLLWATIEHLQDGNIVRPVKLQAAVRDLGMDTTEGEEGQKEMEEEEDAEEDAALARRTLEALEQDNPQTFQYLLEWRRVEDAWRAEMEAREAEMDGSA